MGMIFLMCVFQFPATPLYPRLPEATPPRGTGPCHYPPKYTINAHVYALIVYLRG